MCIQYSQGEHIFNICHKMLSENLFINLGYTLLQQSWYQLCISRAVWFYVKAIRVTDVMNAQK